MLILVQSSSGRSFNWRRTDTGISRVCACLSIASSAIRTALGSSRWNRPGSALRRRSFRRVYFYRAGTPQRATRTRKSNARRRSYLHPSRASERRTRARADRGRRRVPSLAYRGSARRTLTLSRKAGGTGWLRIFTPPPGPHVASMR